MWNNILFFLGSLSIVGGIIAVPLPFPIGLPLMIIGISLLVKSSPRTRAYIYYLAGRYPRYFRYFKFLNQPNNEQDNKS